MSSAKTKKQVEINVPHGLQVAVLGTLFVLWVLSVMATMAPIFPFGFRYLVPDHILWVILIALYPVVYVIVALNHSWSRYSTTLSRFFIAGLLAFVAYVVYNALYFGIIFLSILLMPTKSLEISGALIGVSTYGFFMMAVGIILFMAALWLSDRQRSKR